MIQPLVAQKLGLDVEIRAIIGIIDKLWDKYWVPLSKITLDRDSQVKHLKQFMKMVGYE